MRVCVCGRGGGWRRKRERVREREREREGEEKMYNDVQWSERIPHNGAVFSQTMCHI